MKTIYVDIHLPTHTEEREWEAIDDLFEHNDEIMEWLAFHAKVSTNELFHGSLDIEDVLMDAEELDGERYRIEFSGYVVDVHVMYED